MTTMCAIRRGYVDQRWGQLHYWQGGDLSAGRPLVLLHQSPFSALEYVPLVAELGADRPVIAIDTPNHGNSDGPERPPLLEEYAAAIVEGLVNLGYGPGAPVDLFGSHTGAMIAIEIAASAPEMVRRLALSGPYLRDEDAIEHAIEALVHPADADAALDNFCAKLPQWREVNRRRGIPAEVWGTLRIDNLRQLTRAEFGHAAAYGYAPKMRRRIAAITQPVTLIMVDDVLAEDTRRALTLFPGARFVERGFTWGWLATRTAEVAEILRIFQDEDR